MICIRAKFELFSHPCHRTSDQNNTLCHNWNLPPSSFSPFIFNFLFVFMQTRFTSGSLYLRTIQHCHRTEQIYLYLFMYNENECAYLHETNIQNAYIRLKKIFIYWCVWQVKLNNYVTAIREFLKSTSTISSLHFFCLILFWSAHRWYCCSRE